MFDSRSIIVRSPADAKTGFWGVAEFDESGNPTGVGLGSQLSRHTARILRAEVEMREDAVIYFVAFLDLFAASMVVTVLASYLTDDVGLSASLAGIVGSVYGVVQFFSSPVIGGLSDVIGYRMVLFFSILLCIPAYLMLSFPVFLLVVAARCLAGCFKHTQNLSRTLVSARGCDVDKVRAFGHLNAIGNLGFIAGPALAGRLVGAWHYGAVFQVAAAGFFLNCLVVWVFFPREESRTKESEVVRVPRNPLKQLWQEMALLNWTAQWDLMLVRFLLSFSVLVYRGSFNWLMADKFHLSPELIGYLLSYQGFVAFLSSFFVERISRLCSDQVHCLKHMTLLLALSFVGLWLSAVIFTYVLFLGILCVATSVIRVVSLELTTERCERRERGLVIGASASLVSVSRALAPAVSGFLHDLSGDASVLLAVLLGFLCFYVTRRFSPRNQRIYAVSDETSAGFS